MQAMESRSVATLLTCPSRHDRISCTPAFPGNSQRRAAFHGRCHDRPARPAGSRDLPGEFGRKCSCRLGLRKWHMTCCAMPATGCTCSAPTAGWSTPAKNSTSWSRLVATHFRAISLRARRPSRRLRQGLPHWRTRDRPLSAPETSDHAATAFGSRMVVTVVAPPMRRARNRSSSTSVAGSTQARSSAACSGVLVKASWANSVSTST